YDYEGLDSLVPLAEELTKHNKNYKFLLVGDGPARSALEEKIHARRLKSQFILTGRVPHKNVHDYYALCDAMIYPRKSMRLTETTTPLKPLEAMASGKLVFLTDIGGHKELAVNHETAIFIPQNMEPEETAKRIDSHLDAKNLQEEIIKNAYEYVKDVRCADSVAKNYYIF
ncbi:MAG: glycosyltransferase, partial [Pseudomonadota bacterium]